MAPRQAKQNVQKVRRQCSLPKGERKSARIQRRQERTVSKDTNTKPKHPLPSPTSNTPGTEACHSPPAMLKANSSQVSIGWGTRTKTIAKNPKVHLVSLHPSPFESNGGRLLQMLLLITHMTRGQRAASTITRPIQLRIRAKRDAGLRNISTKTIRLQSVRRKHDKKKKKPPPH